MCDLLFIRYWRSFGLIPSPGTPECFRGGSRATKVGVEVEVRRGGEGECNSFLSHAWRRRHNFPSNLHRSELLH